MGRLNTNADDVCYRLPFVALLVRYSEAIPFDHSPLHYSWPRPN